MAGIIVYGIVYSLYDADTMTVAVWCYNSFIVFKIRFARIDTCEMKSGPVDKNNPKKYKSKEHENIEILLEKCCKKEARRAKSFVISLVSDNKIDYNIDAENTTTENNRVDDLLFNGNINVQIKVEAYEAKFGRQLAEVFTLSDPSKSINDKLIDAKLAYLYSGGTKLSFYNQLVTLKGLYYIINLIDNSGIMTHEQYLKL